MGPGECGLKRLIVTADDFGLSVPVNEAVEAAHRHGILTAASLMVGAEATDDAVARAVQLPDLAVGLHLVVVDGRPVLPAAELPDLVGADGRFSGRLVSAGLRFFFNRRVRRQLAAEIRAQFEAFEGTGLALDHVNTHHHMHLHPTVMALIIDIGRDYGLRAIRVPAEFASATRGTNPMHLFLKPWIGLLRRRLRRAGVSSNDYLYGLTDSGRLNTDEFVSIFNDLPEGVSELFSHPATRRWSGIQPAARDYAFQQEYEALIAPESAAAVRRAGIELIAFRNLP